MEVQSLCLICHDLIETKHNYTLPECKHCYHTECIIEWFQKGDNRCPYCQNRGINNLCDHNNNLYQTDNNFKIYFYPIWGDNRWWGEETKTRHKIGVQKFNDIKKYVNKTKQPNWLINEFKEVDKTEKEYKLLFKKRKDYQKIMKQQPYDDALSKMKYLNQMCFNKQRKICTIKNHILTFPYYSIIIPTTNI
jgi:hypothetical protein